jgi:hypothetical protein
VCRYPNLNKHLFSQMQVSHLYKSENPDRNSIKNIPKTLMISPELGIKNVEFLLSNNTLLLNICLVFSHSAFFI